METTTATKKSQTLTKCCNTCPFLLENANKPKPEGWNPDKSKGQTDWYTQENLNNLWKGLREGEAMVCHTHDPDSKEYGGKGATHEKPKMCLGSVMMLFPHAQAFEKHLNADPKHNPNKAYTAYRKNSNITINQFDYRKEGFNSVGEENNKYHFRIRYDDGKRMFYNTDIADCRPF